MGELIVDDIRIFKRFLKSVCCLQYFSLKEYAQHFLLKKLWCSNFENSNAHALQTNTNQTQPVSTPCRVVNHLCCISAGLSGGVGGNVHVLHGKIPNTRPPNPHGASAVVSYRACARVVCEYSDAIPTKRFTSPMPKAAQYKK